MHVYIMCKREGGREEREGERERGREGGAGEREGGRRGREGGREEREGEHHLTQYSGSIGTSINSSYDT